MDDDRPSGEPERLEEVLRLAIAGEHGAIAAGVAAVAVVALAVWYRRWLGGVTGDTLGATVELTEIAVFLTAVELLGVQ